jgi:hypothetical protein
MPETSRPPARFELLSEALRRLREVPSLAEAREHLPEAIDAEAAARLRPQLEELAQVYTGVEAQSLDLAIEAAAARRVVEQLVVEVERRTIR